ncbi:MAG: hypothetical protein IKO41_00245 [Lachnospiraceae bacterium]|nr:hypothetical protein [Lachnospiraceae bacterium]
MGTDTVTLYSACRGGIEPGRRFLEYERAVKYMHDANLYFLCFGQEPGLEYFLNFEEIEWSLDYAESLWTRWPAGWEPCIARLTVPEDCYLRCEIRGHDCDVIWAYKRAMVSRVYDGEYLGGVTCESLADFDPQNVVYD